MEQFKVLLVDAIHVIASTDADFRMIVKKNDTPKITGNGALIEATHYIVSNGCFVKSDYFVFEAVTTERQSDAAPIDISLFSKAIEFFFYSVLDTEYFVKSIPECSSLYQGMPKIAWV